MLQTIYIFKKMKSYKYLINSIGGYSLVIAGIIAAIALCFHPDEFIPGSVLNAAWSPVHLGLLFAFSISIFGVVGIFNSLENKPGIIGVVAYTLGIIGCAWSAAVVVLEVFVFPILAKQNSVQVPLMDLMNKTSSFSNLGIFFMSAVMVWILAWVLIGIVLLRSTLFKRYIGVLVIIASIAIAIPTHFAGGMSDVLHILISLTFGLSWMLVGNVILKIRN